MKKVSVLLVAVLVVLSGLAKAVDPTCPLGTKIDKATCDCKAEEAAQPAKAIKPAAKKVAKPVAAKPCDQGKLRAISADLGRIEAMATVPLRAEELEKLRGQVEAARQKAFECAEPDLVSRAAQLAKKLAGIKANPDPTPATGTAEAPKANEEKAEGDTLFAARICAEWCRQRNRGAGEMKENFCFCSDDLAALLAGAPAEEQKGWCSRHSVACTVVLTIGAIGALAVIGGIVYFVSDTQRGYVVTQGSLRQPLRGLPGQPQGFGIRF